MRETARVLSLVRLALSALALVPVPTIAHHSFSAYDMNQTKKVEGTIKVFRWGAPHSSVVLVSKDEKGKPFEMSIVSGSPAEFSRQGIAPRDLHPGDKLTVVYHPNGNGRPGGVMAKMTTAEGKSYSSAEVASSEGGRGLGAGASGAAPATGGQ